MLAIPYILGRRPRLDIDAAPLALAADMSPPSKIRRILRRFSVSSSA
jgi:hypothetical protein